MFATYRDELAKKSTAGVDVTLELREGLALLSRTVERSRGSVAAGMQEIVAKLTDAPDEIRLQTLLSPELAAMMQAADDRPRAATLPRPIRIDARAQRRRLCRLV